MWHHLQQLRTLQPHLVVARQVDDADHEAGRKLEIGCSSEQVHFAQWKRWECPPTRRQMLPQDHQWSTAPAVPLGNTGRDWDRTKQRTALRWQRDCFVNSADKNAHYQIHPRISAGGVVGYCKWTGLEGPSTMECNMLVENVIVRWCIAKQWSTFVNP